LPAALYFCLASQGIYGKGSLDLTRMLLSKMEGASYMDTLNRIFRSKMERLVPLNDIDKLMILALEGSKQQRIQAYLQLANIVVDLLPDPYVFKESYRDRIIECALVGTTDSEIEIRYVAKLAAAQQMISIVPRSSKFEIQLKELVNLIRDKIDSDLYVRPSSLNDEQVDRITSLINVVIKLERTI
jgi:hypothetical protein